MTEPGSESGGLDPANKPIQDKRYYSNARIRKGLFYFLSGRGMAAIAAVVVPILLVRVLSVVDYAAYTAFSGLLIVIMAATNLGLERVIPRYFPELQSAGAGAELYRFAKVLTVMRIASLGVASLVLIIMYEPLSSWFNLPKSYKPVLGFAVYVIGFGLSMHLSRSLHALMMQKEAAEGMVFEWITKLGFLLALLYIFKQIGLTEALLLQGSTAMLGCFHMFFRLNGRLRKTVTTDGSRILDYKQVAKTGWQNYLWNISGMHTDPSITKLVSSAFFSAPITAALGFAYSIIGVLQRYLPAVLLLSLIEPAVMARYCETRDFGQTSRLLKIVLRVNIFILAPSTVWFFLHGEPLVIALTGGKYIESVWLITALMIVLMLKSHTLIMQMAVNAVEKSEFLLWSNAWSLLLVLPVAIAVYFLEMQGLIGGLIAIIIVRNVYIVNRLRKDGYNYAVDWKGLGKIYVIACISGLGTKFIVPFIPVSELDSFLLVSGALAESVFAAVCMTMLFLGIAYVWKPFTEFERETLNKFFGRRCFVW